MDVTTLIMWTWIVVSKGYIWAIESPLFFTPESGSWSYGKSYCENYNGRLVTLDTQSKYDLVMAMDTQYHNNSIFSTDAGPFIGLSTESADCTNFTWISGKSLDWSKWDLSEGQPKYCDTSRCVNIKSGLFRTSNCLSKRLAICELGEFLPNSSLFISSQAMRWADGYMLCGMIGGRLVVLDDQEKQDKVTLEIRNNVNVSEDLRYWIGLTTTTQTCQNLTWVDGTALGWTNFVSSTECTTEQCVMWSQQNNGWFTGLCDAYHQVLCENGYEQMEYFYYNDTKVEWNKATDVCTQTGGVLAILDNAERYIHALASLNTWGITDDVWIGLRTDYTDCTGYSWTNGHPLSWANWNPPEEPDNCSEQLCVRLKVGGFCTAFCWRKIVALCVYVTAKITTAAGNTTTAGVTTAMTTTTSVTTAMASTTPVPTTDPTIANTSCDCCTRNNTNVTRLSHAELQDVITQLKAELYVNKNNTSAYRRRRISVYESRPSSMVMGGVACVIIAVPIGWIVVPDLITLCLFLFKRVSKRNVVTPGV